MGRDHLGKPSGANKSEGTGLRKDMPPEKLHEDEKATEKYTNGEDELADNIKMRHPNRNTEKENPTNAGGYKS